MVYGMVLAAVFGCYVVSSFILFKFPSILHKRKNVKFVCRHISHRGGAGENYENTMTAFKYAVSLGTDMLELDVHLTRDGQVVVAHDPNLQRTTHSHLAITDLDYAELPRVKDNLPIDFMPGSVFSRPSEQDRQLPLLENVYRAFPNTAINIDIKVPNDSLITKVSELTKRYNREHLTVWGNFSDAITERCYKENSAMGLLFSLRRVIILVVQLYTGLLPFMPLKETHLEIFMPRHLFNMYKQRQSPVSTPRLAEADPNTVGSKNGSPQHLSKTDTGSSRSSVSVPSEMAWWMSPVASLAHALVIRPALFSHLSKRGIQTYLWVLNSEEDFHQAFKSGATGVMTDYPSKLKAFLAENPQYLRNYSAPPDAVTTRDTTPALTTSSLLIDAGCDKQEHQPNHVATSDSWQGDRLPGAPVGSASVPLDDVSLRSDDGVVHDAMSSPRPVVVSSTHNDVRSRCDTTSCSRNEALSSVTSNGSLLEDNSFNEHLLDGCTASSPSTIVGGGVRASTTSSSCPQEAATSSVVERTRIIQELPVKIS